MKSQAMMLTTSQVINFLVITSQVIDVTWNYFTEYDLYIRGMTSHNMTSTFMDHILDV